MVKAMEKGRITALSAARFLNEFQIVSRRWEENWIRIKINFRFVRRLYRN
jgi:hypothetical protein